MNAKALLVTVVGLTTSQLSFGEASPWLPSPGAVNLSLSQVEQSADEFYFADDKQSLPGDLSLSTTTLSIVYGLNDRLALDAKIGYAASDFDAPIENNNLYGVTDSAIGLTWGVVNEYSSERGLPSIAVRFGVIIDGDYDTGTINAIGDGGNGVEASIAVGKVFNSYFALSSEAGVRNRSDNIPTELFYNVNAYFTINPTLTTFVGYHVDNSRDGLQIGGNGFSPDRFPEVEEDKEYVQLGARYSLTPQLSAAFSLAKVIDGRNTALSDVYAFNLGYSF